MVLYPWTAYYRQDVAPGTTRTAQCAETGERSCSGGIGSASSTPNGKRRHRTSLCTSKCSIFGGIVTPLSATIPRSRSRRGWVCRNWVSKESREGPQR